jgi:hypothetical protein
MKPEEEKVSEEQKLFAEHLKQFWNAYICDGPFSSDMCFRWFFVRGLDVGKSLNVVNEKEKR